MTSDDDAQLLRRYAEENSQAAFTELVERRLGLVYSAALRRCGNAHLASEVAQRVFTALARQAPKLTHHTVLTAWLYTATRNITIDAIRAERRRKLTEEQRMQLQDVAARFDPKPDWERIRPVLDQAIDSLSERDREAVLLRFFERRRYAEIGAMLALSEDGARVRVERATEKLRAWLGAHGIGSTADALAALLTAETLSAAPAGAAPGIASAAMVGATGSAVPAATGALLSLMTATKTMVTLGVFGAVAITAAIYQAQRVQIAAFALARQTATTAAAEAETQSLQRRVQAAEAEEASLQESLAEARRAATAAEASFRAAADKAYSASRPAVALANRLRADSEFRQLYRDEWRIRTRLQLLSFFKAAKLTPEQAARFSGLLADARVAADAAAQRLPTLPPAPLLEQIRSEFGDEVANAYHDYARQNGARALTDYLLIKGAFAGFTPEQAARVTDLIVDASPAYRGGGEWQSTHVNWDDVVRQAADLLSPDQLAVVRSLGYRAQKSEMLEAAAWAPTLQP
jgi:RNA polymerase sigma factor (sigma-70 family)